MRTTLNIDDELLKEAKIAAIREGITLTEYIQRALRHECLERETKAAHRTWRMPTLEGEPIPGFDWSWSMGKMVEFLEGPDARP